MIMITLQTGHTVYTVNLCLVNSLAPRLKTALNKQILLQLSTPLKKKKRSTAVPCWFIRPLNSPSLSDFLLIWGVFECSSPFLEGYKLFQPTNYGTTLHNCEALQTVMFSYEDTSGVLVHALVLNITVGTSRFCVYSWRTNTASHRSFQKEMCVVMQCCLLTFHSRKKSKRNDPCTNSK